MKNIVTFLKQLDLSTTEIKIYLKLLSSGAMTVSELAEKVKLNRTAIYNHINSLLKKGLIRQLQGKTIRIEANPADNLYHLVDHRINAANLLRDSLPSVVNGLNKYNNTQTINTTSETKYFKGVIGVKAIYQDSLKAKTIRCYYNPKDLECFFPENFELFYNKLKNNPQMQMYEICEDTSISRMRYKKEMNVNHFWKFLPDGTKITANDILMYDGKVAIINLRSKDSIEGIIIQNNDYYENSMQIYDVLWSLLPNPGQ